MKTTKIYFSDLNEDAQKRILEAMEIDKPSDYMNCDINTTPIVMNNSKDEDYYCKLSNTDIVPVKNDEYPKLKDQDKYIDEDLLAMRDFEDGFDPIIKETIAMARVNNYLLVEAMGDEMADLYKRHLSNILEYNSQSMFHGFQGLKDDMIDYVKSLIVNKK